MYLEVEKDRLAGRLDVKCGYWQTAALRAWLGWIQSVSEYYLPRLPRFRTAPRQPPSTSSPHGALFNDFTHPLSSFDLDEHCLQSATTRFD